MGEDKGESKQRGEGLHASDVPPPPVARPPRQEPAYPDLAGVRDQPSDEGGVGSGEGDRRDAEMAPEVEDGSDEKLLGLLCHLLALVGCLIPLIGNILGPLILWLMKRGDSRIVEIEGRKSVNFQMLFSAAVVILWLPVLMVGWLPLVGGLIAWLSIMAISAGVIANVVYVVLATMAVNTGGRSKYPVALDLLGAIEAKMAKSAPGD